MNGDVPSPKLIYTLNKKSITTCVWIRWIGWIVGWIVRWIGG